MGNKFKFDKENPFWAVFLGQKMNVASTDHLGRGAAWLRIKENGRRAQPCLKLSAADRQQAHKNDAAGERG